MEVPGPILERHVSSCEYESIVVHLLMIIRGGMCLVLVRGKSGLTLFWSPRLSRAER